MSAMWLYIFYYLCKNKKIGWAFWNNCFFPKGQKYFLHCRLKLQDFFKCGDGVMDKQGNLRGRVTWCSKQKSRNLEPEIFFFSFSLCLSFFFTWCLLSLRVCSQASTLPLSYYKTMNSHHNITSDGHNWLDTVNYFQRETRKKRSILDLL